MRSESEKREAQLLASRRYEQRNREKRRLKSLLYSRANPERMKRNGKKWRQENPDKMKAWLSIPENRVAYNIRRRTIRAIKNNQKTGHTLDLLGCSVPELRTHLESLFRLHMTWDNYGSVWHIDHRKPCVKFDLSDPKQQKQCFNYRNLQPLFAVENLSKGAK